MVPSRSFFAVHFLVSGLRNLVQYCRRRAFALSLVRSLKRGRQDRASRPYTLVNRHNLLTNAVMQACLIPDIWREG